MMALFQRNGQVEEQKGRKNGGKIETVEREAKEREAHEREHEDKAGTPATLGDAVCSEP